MENSEKAASADEVAIPLVAVADPGDEKTAADVGFTEEDNASIEKQQQQKQQKHFTGMTKEELEAYVNDPFWHRLRLVSMIIFCVVWVCLFAAVIVIVATSPRCPPRPTRQFWQRPVYRLQLPAFSPAKDDDPAAVGSIAGLTRRLDHILNTLGLSNILLGGRLLPAGPSGCPIKFAELNQAFGTLDELKELTKTGRRKGFNVMLELDLSQADPSWASDAPQVFATGSGGNGQLPARYGSGPAWKNDRLHLPRASCDSLNVTSPVTLARLEASLTSWLNAGVSGFLLTNVAYIAPSSADLGGSAAAWFDRNPTSALFSNASVDFVRWTRRLLNRETGRLGRDLALFVDPGDTGFPQPPQRLAAYLDSASDGAHAVVSVDLGQPDSAAAANKAPTADLVETVLKEAAGRGSVLFATTWPSLRLPVDPVYATLLSLTLPGVPCLYYGQELGMAHVSGVVNYRDNGTGASETPMQWADSQFNAGWLANATASLTWINLTARADDIREHNLRRLGASGHPQSALQVTKDLLALATSAESLQWGGIEFVVDRKLPAEILAFKRRAHRYPAVLVVANAGTRPEIINLTGPDGVEGSGSLRLMHTQVGGGAGEQLASAYKVGNIYQLDKVFVPGFTVLIFQAS